MERDRTNTDTTLSMTSPPQGDYFPSPRRTGSPEGLPSSPPTDNPFEPSLEDVVPDPYDKKRSRTLVLCFDGTGDQFDDDNSNVVQFFSMLKKDDPKHQLVYYQAGIGTYTVPQVAKPLAAKFHRLLDMMVGMHLDAHVMGGYEFLMQNYESGDKICIFGFSRGAYTARALAGMIHKVGLLPRCNHQQVPFAYKMYSRDNKTGWHQSWAFKQAFSIDVEIEFLGVWDTVGSVGIIPKLLPFTLSNSHVRYFRHAIALDERRARFKPNFWQHQTGEQKNLAPPPCCMPKAKVHRHPASKQKVEPERQFSTIGDHVTDIEEVWFTGCHCDVGGGACFKLETGILFHKEMLKLAGLDHSKLYPHVKPRPPPMAVPSPIAATHQRDPTTASSATDTTAIEESPKACTSTRSRLEFWANDFVNEEAEDLKDALSPINDMLAKKWYWWILEFVPQKLKYQRDHEDRAWVTRTIWGNRGKARYIPKYHGVRVHRTVRTRMEAEALALGAAEKYVPKPKWGFEPIWVD